MTGIGTYRWLFSQNNQTQNRSRIPPLHSVHQEAVLRTEYSFCTGEGGFWYRISLLYPRSLFWARRASENASRTPGSLFEHGTHIPYRRRPSPVRNASRHVEPWRVVNCFQIFYLCSSDTTLYIKDWTRVALWIAFRFFIFVLQTQLTVQKCPLYICCELLSDFLSLFFRHNKFLFIYIIASVVNCFQIFYLCSSDTTIVF